jgi:tetratricopeptide (TPR) repeat protein
VLSDRARLVLEGAAVAGDPFEPELAAAAAGTSEASALEALDELLALDLVRGTEVPRRFRFRHTLIRRAVYESTPAGWRLGAHGRSAEALATRGASATARAHHVERSAREGDAAAVATLREAGDAAAQRAPASAAIWFSHALRLLPDAAPAEVRVELLLSRARALVATGQFADGHAALLHTIGLVPAGSVALRVRLTTACAGVEHLLGRHDEAHARLARAMDSVRDPASREAAALMIELAMDGFSGMKYDVMHEWAERALSTAGPLGDRPLFAAAVAVLAFANATSGATPEAEARRSKAAALVADLDDDELAVRLDAAANLAGAELYLDRYADAAAHAERAIAGGRATGQSEFIALPYSILAQVKLLRGELAEAGELLDNAIEAARLSGNIQALASNLGQRSFAALASGDVAVALALAEECVELTSELDQSLACAAGVALAAALLETGDPRRAVDALIASSGGDELSLIPGVWRAKFLELLTRCWLALGRRNEAERAAAGARAMAAALRLRMAASMADRAAAAVALDAGDPNWAAERSLAAASAADQVGVPVEAALARTLAGRALAQAR